MYINLRWGSSFRSIIFCFRHAFSFTFHFSRWLHKPFILILHCDWSKDRWLIVDVNAEGPGCLYSWVPSYIQGRIAKTCIILWENLSSKYSSVYHFFVAFDEAHSMPWCNVNFLPYTKYLNTHPPRPSVAPPMHFLLNFQTCFWCFETSHCKQFLILMLPHLCDIISSGHHAPFILAER